MPATPLETRLLLDLAFHAKAFPFNDHGLCVMQQPVEDSRRQRAVIVKYLGPLFKGSIRRDQDCALFIAKRDHLEEQVGTGLVNGQVAEFIENKQCGFGVFLKFLLETTCTPGSTQRVNDIDGTGKENRVALEAGDIAKCCGQMSLPQSHPRVSKNALQRAFFVTGIWAS
jgi:hypothetical protein